MYRIIGADGREYGPVDAEQIRRWVAAGRANANTRVQEESSPGWKTLADFPELMGNPLPPRVDGSDAPPGTARQQVEGPAIGLMVTAILGFVAQALQFILNIFGLTEGLRGAGPDAAFSFLTGTIGLVFGVIGVAIGVLILVGAVKMKKLESHSWSMAASILALAPCISPCCIVGLPIGIWSLVVLSKPEVSDAFKERTPPDA